MKKVIVLIIAILGVLAIASALIFLVKPGSRLPNSFTINIYGDYTSAGASRYGSTTLVFENRELISGLQTYDVSATGIQRHCQWTLDVESLTWTEGPSENCETSVSSVPLNIAALEQKINAGEIKPEEECFNLDTCYRMLE